MDQLIQWPRLLTMLWLVVAATATAQDGVTTVLLAKQIITMDSASPQAAAVAVRDGRIMAVGDRPAVIAAAGKGARIDKQFEGAILVPGFVEQHIHPVLSALALSSTVISIESWTLPDRTTPAVRDRTHYLAELRKAEKALGSDTQPLISWGFHHNFHGALSRDDLDAISNQRPIIIWHRSAHELILNSAAMAEVGVTPDSVATTSAFIQAQIDLSSGHFWEGGAFDYLMPKLMPLFGDNLQSGLQMTRSYLHAAGVTTSAEPGGVAGFYKPMIAALSGEDTPFRFYFIPDGRTLAQQHEGAALVAATEAVASGARGRTAFLRRQVKLFSDGAIYSQLMQMRDGYQDGHHGEWLMEKALFENAFRTYWDAGYQLHVHQNGDLGLDRVLDALRDNLRRNPRKDHRTTIVHFGFATPQQIAELARLGAIVSANPYYTVALADKYGEVGLGKERADAMVRLADVVRLGIPLSLHSDMPMAPAQPLYLMWAAVNRTTFSGRVAGPDLALTPEQALRAVTLNAAHSIRLEQEIGSITVGKKANFTALAENPLTVPSMAIKDIPVLATVLEGQVFAVQ